jgi:GNAT superfamily N-acetyltransferase
MRVRQGTAADAEVLAEVARRAITITAAPFYDQLQIDQWAGHFTEPVLTQMIATRTVFVVWSRQSPCGFASLLSVPAGHDEVGELFVDPDFSGQGVARLALDAVEREAKARNIGHLRVDASLLAAPVLEHLGYVVEERYDKHVGSVVYRNTWLTKSL